MSRAVRLIGAALAGLTIVATARTARAQSVLDRELRLAPQYVQYRLRAPADETVSQLAIPLFVTIPAGSRLSVDVGTAYSRALVRSGDFKSEISGLTDTQVRGNLTLGNDLVVITAGVSLPTGDASVTEDQLLAAGRIGNDFLGFPISNMGTGLAATGGIALARAVGPWNLGVGAAVRRSAAYEPFDVPDERFRYQPGNEVRARIGVDREVGSGRAVLGLSYSAFGRDNAGGSAYNTGDRLVAQGGLSGLVGSNEFTVVAYNVFRGPGEYASGERAGRENIANLFAALAMNALGTIVEPSIEVRHWHQRVVTPSSLGEPDTARSEASLLGTVSVRTRLELGGIGVFPGIGYTRGRIAAVTEEGSPTRAGLDGFRLQLAMQVSP